MLAPERRQRFDNELAPDERFREVTSILALGFLRVRQRVALPAASARRNPAELPMTGLEVSPDTVLSVTNPVNGPESPTPGARA